MASSQKLAAIVLAGGASRRFGANNKLLADVGGHALIAHTANAVYDAGIVDIIVVTGAEHAAYVSALREVPVKFVGNPSWDHGMGTSIAAGMQAVNVACDGVFVVPGDMARLTVDVFCRLASAFAADGAHRIVVPVTGDGVQRNPVLWPRRYFSDLSNLSGACGGKKLLGSLGTERRDVVFDDAGIFDDIDTLADYERFMREPRRDE